MECLVDGRTAHIATLQAADAGGCAAPVVMLHGACQDHRAWQPVLPALARAGCAALAPDLPGHSDSSGPPCAGIADMAAWTLALLDACGIARCVLAGHSMGSLVALHVAVLAPRRIAALVLVASAAPMRVTPALLQRARSEPDAALRDIARWSHKGSRDNPPDAVAVERTLGLMQSVHARWPLGDLLANDLAACDADTDALRMAARLRVPVQLVLGAHDRMVPPQSAQALRAALGDCAVSTLDTGHAVMDEAPAELAALLLAQPAAL